MKTIGSIIGALAFLVGAGFAFAAMMNIGDETTSAIAQGALATALIVFAVGVGLGQQLSEIRNHLAEQNELLKDQSHALNAIARRTTDRRLRKERAEK